MLLDAMCNMFGGIVLISVLMAVLTHSQTSSQQAQKAAQEARELIQRRIDRAERDIAAAEQLRDQMAQKESNPGTLAAGELMRQREDLTARVENAREALAKADRTRVATRASQYSDPGERQRFLLGEMSTLKKTRISLQNRIASLYEEIPRLERRLVDLGERFTKARAEATRKLRLPRERTSSKTPFYVIVRYGEVFPRYKFVDGNLVLNETSINWRTKSNSITGYPVRGSGIAVLNSKDEKDEQGLAQMQDWLKPVSKDSVYIIFIVYPDSFGSFNAAKERVTNMGLEFSWIPREYTVEVSFGEGGKAPPPPL
ncbi:MAG: hypothetical protein ACAI35_19630 [Candidatus Methylacidiphilales bacterium]|nr:hypothetical protein [Candidatus Methylacidiphilales bacterium]